MMWLVVIGALAIGVMVGSRLGRSKDVTVAAPSPERVGSDAASQDRELMRIVEALPLGVLVYDRRGDQVFANAAARRLADDRLHDALISSAVDGVVAEAANGGVAQDVLQLYGSSRTHLAIRGVPVDASVVGQTAVLVTVEDTTEVHAADLLRRDFVANVSHELKTPVGAMGVLAETLLDVDDPDVVNRLAGRIQAESHRLATTVDDLLTLARIESGEHTQLAELRVDDLFTEVHGRVGSAAEDKGIELDYSVEPPQLTLMGDRVQLVSGVSNLIDNAVKYSEADSVVAVEAAVSGDTVSIAVADQGIGIPASDLDRIFERFYRVDRGRSRDTGGTGLGLSIVRHVLLNHGGSVHVESEEGVGTTFVVMLPGARRDPAPAEVSQRSRSAS